MRKLIAVLTLLTIGVGVVPAIAADCECPKVEQTTIRVCVDKTRTLSQLIDQGKYDWLNPDIARHFSIEPGSGVVPTDIILLHFDKEMTTDQVLSEMERLSLRPITLQELLSLGAQHPDLQHQFPIVALGTVQQVDLDRSVAYLDLGAKRYLDLRWIDRGWGGFCRFAAVRK